MALDGIRWHSMALDGIRWHSMALTRRWSRNKKTSIPHAPCTHLTHSIIQKHAAEWCTENPSLPQLPHQTIIDLCKAENQEFNYTTNNYTT